MVPHLSPNFYQGPVNLQCPDTTKELICVITVLLT